MGSLTSCLKKAGTSLRAEDKSAILALSRQYRAEGLSPNDAAMKAIDTQLSAVGKLIEQEQAPKKVDLFGEAPNASQQAAEDLRQKQKKKEQAQRDSAPTAEGFDLGMVDQKTGDEVAPGQAEISVNEDEAKAKADLMNALADLGSLLSAPGRMNIAPEQEQKLLPILTRLFDAAFRLGYTKFKDAAKFALDQIKSALGQETANSIDLNHLQGAYIAMSGGKTGADNIRTVSTIESKSEVENHTAQTDNQRKEQSNVPSANASVERHSPQPATEPAVGQAVSDELRATGGEPSQAGGRTDRGNGSGQLDGVGLSSGGAATARERGDQRVHRRDGELELASITSGDQFGERGSDVGIRGIPPEPISTKQVRETAESFDDRVIKGREQKAAASIKPINGDLQNIRDTLPQLLPAQQEDVHKAETRFAKPNGFGMLFTNGTGTGKTFSGLGIIKRFELKGKKNAIILAPDDKIAADWIKAGKLLGLDITKLADTKDSGKGIVITTYANFGANDKTASRQWDLVVADEAHSLMQEAHGTPTGYLHNLRAITYHPDGVHTRHSMLHREEIERSAFLHREIKANNKIMSNDDTMDAMVSSLRSENEKLEAEVSKIDAKLRADLDALKDEVHNRQSTRPRLVALSATPFAYEKTIDWANGYLFEYNDGHPSEEREFRGYNSGSNRERYFMQHFGYTMRYNKLTEPDGRKVDRGLLQRNWNANLKKAGSLSGRMLDVVPDYDRRFVTVDSAIGHRIDQALEWISKQRQDAPKGDDGFSMLSEVINDKFKYLQKRYLLEAIKATEVIPIIKQHLALNRKVVVFHDYKKGGGFNPFSVTPGTAKSEDPNQQARIESFRKAVTAFNTEFKDLVEAPLGDMDSPIEVFARELPQTMFINGDEKKSDLLQRYEKFQDDASGPQVMLVQSAKNKGWSGHDTTGKHQRVLINLGQPTAPTLAIQQEGRIYRTGQASDAIMRYLNTGTNWERWTFASTIAGRASTAENLGMGEMARALKDSFIQSFDESDAYPPGHEGEGKGGKERDKAANDALTEYDRAKTYYWATQKKNSKTKAQEGADYFATPEPIGLKMVEWLDARPEEDTLEPSAGHGAISRWLPDVTKRTVVEPSLALRSRLALVMNPNEDRIIAGTFEELGINNKYDGIVMNPPFGSGGKTAVDHLAKAATHLRDGGRIVALIPTGPAADKKFEKWFYETSEKPVKPLLTHPTHGPIYKGDTITSRASFIPGASSGVTIDSIRDGVLQTKVTSAGRAYLTAITPESITGVRPTGKRTEQVKMAEGLSLVADIKLPQVTFERAGTGVATRIVVIEKSNEWNTGGVYNRDFTDITTVADLFDSLENMALPDRAKKIQEVKEEPVKTSKPETKPEAPRAKLGDMVTIMGKQYEVTTYTTNAGKELRGTWVPTKAIALYHGARSTFPVRGKGFFVRERDFPKDADSIDSPMMARGQDDLLSSYDREEALKKQQSEAEALKQENKPAPKPRQPVYTADQIDMFNPQSSLFAKGMQLDDEAFRKAFGSFSPVQMTVDQVQRISDSLTKDWTNGPKIVVVNSTTELPVKAPSDARGLYLRGTVYLVASAHASTGMLARTLAHESVAHYGLRKMLGDAGWYKLMTNVQLALASGNKPLNAIRAEVRKAYADKDGVFRLGKNQEADEVAARAVEDAIDAATGEFRPGYSFLKEAYAKIAQFLRDHGIPIKFTNLELQGMLSASSKWLKESGAQISGEAVPAFARGSTAESNSSELNALHELSKNDETFKFDKSGADTVEGIVSDVYPFIKVRKLTNIPGETRYNFTTPDGNTHRMMVRPFNPYAGEHGTLYGFDLDGNHEMTGMVMERPGNNPESAYGKDDVYIDVSLSEPGKYGAAIYSIASNYAHNSGKVFIGDPAGLSDHAMKRRIDHMLSSALKFGTTEHLAPHPRQVNGDLGIGVPALDWTYGDDLANIESLIRVSNAIYGPNNPISFEPISGRYLDKKGRELDDDSIRSIIKSGRYGASGIGITTAKRGAVIASILREEGAQTRRTGKHGNGVLEKLLAISVQHPASTKDIAYARSASAAGKLQPSTAPLDTVLRVFGGNLAARITSPAYGWLARTLDAITPETLKAGLVSDYGLRNEYLDRKQEMKTAQRQHARHLGDVIDGLQNLDRKQSRVAYFWMQEHPSHEAEAKLMEQLPQESRATLEALKDQIDKLGQEAVKLGLITAETIDRNRFAYLHRSYKRYEMEDGSSVKGARSRAIKILGDQFKGRGLRDDADMAKIAALDWYKRKTQEGKADVSLKGIMFHRLERRSTPDLSTPDMIGDASRKLGKLREIKYWPVSEPIPLHLADWRNDGQWEARFFDKSGKVGMWRDFTLEERTAMGEIQEVRYGVAKTIMQMSRDVETARFLDWIAKNEAVGHESMLPEDAIALESASTSLGKAYKTNEWVQVPTSAIPGTAGLKRFGNLAGRWVPGPVWNDLRQIATINDQDVISKVYGPMLRAWKVSKTALSPATHMNNVMANFVMADAHDIQAKHMLTALRTYRSYKTNEVGKELMDAFLDNGGDAGMFNTEEIKNEIFEPLLRQLEDDLNSNANKTTRLMMATHVMGLLRAREFRQAFAMIGETKTAKQAGVPFKKLIKLYGQEDEMFRLAAFIKAREDGLSDHDAGKFARESLLNYEINAPWIAALRKSAMPFIAFTYRAAPMMAKVAAERPWKLAKWMMVAGALNALGYLMSGGDEDKERAFMPDEKSGRVWGIVPKLIRMPWNDANKQPVFLDIRRWIPVGDMVDTGQSHAAVPVPPPLMPGGPVVILGELIANTSLFTGQNITKATDSLSEKWGKAAGYLWKAAMPNMLGLPGTYASDAVMNAGTGKTDTFGREQSLPMAVSSSFGVKLASYPQDVLIQNEARKLSAEIGELRRGLRSDSRQLARKGIDQDDMDKRTATMQEKIKERTDEFNKKKKAAGMVQD